MQPQQMRMNEVLNEPLEYLAPIRGYAQEHIVSLELAVKPLVDLVPGIEAYVYAIKQKCKKPADHLTPDESASIMLYTMGCDPMEQSLFSVLNKTLRDRDRKVKLRSWYQYLRLFLNALQRLPSISTTIFRGVKNDLGKRYVVEDTVVWWGFSSCTASVGILEQNEFLGKTGPRTLFTIACRSAKDIQKHSYYMAEKEVLLLAATELRVVSRLDQGDLQIVQLEETTPPYPLLEPIKIITPQSEPSSPIIVQSNVTSLNVSNPSNPIASRVLNIPANAQWIQEGATVAGNGETGDATHQLHSPYGVYAISDKILIITDRYNHRVVEWTVGDSKGQVVAGGYNFGSDLKQLYSPTDVIFDTKTNNILICDRDNRRVVSWSRCNGPTLQGKILLDNVKCWGLAIDTQQYLYVSDIERHEVRRYRMGEKIGTIVAGGNGAGDSIKQLNGPRYIFVDQQQDLYVSDYNNHRVVKWCKDATEGSIVAGGQGRGNGLSQLWNPSGLFVDSLDTIYIADTFNHRIVRWPKNARQGNVILGGNGCGKTEIQLNEPYGITFDQHGNIYVADQDNHRVQKFTRR